MGLYKDMLLPGIMDLAMGNSGLQALRARTASGLRGEVLEIGFGTGLNVAHYPPEVTRVLAVEPARANRQLAARRITASPAPIEYVGLDAQSIPLGTESVDHVLVTWTMCTIADVSAALSEMRRVLRPGGQLHFAEHGRSPNAAVARWQDRLNPLQRRLAGGCNMNRPIDQLIENAGLRIARLDTEYIPGLRVLSYMYVGVAEK